MAKLVLAEPKEAMLHGVAAPRQLASPLSSQIPLTPAGQGRPPWLCQRQL